MARNNPRKCGSSSNSNENNYSNARDLSQEALWRLQMATAQSQQIYVDRPPSAFSGLVDYSGYSPHIPTVTSSLSQQSFSPTQQLAPHEMLQAAQRYGTLRKSGKQPPLPPQRKDMQQQAKPPQQMAFAFVHPFMQQQPEKKDTPAHTDKCT
ncbi:GM18114 [Drosophila sechellia]|uniref:GM18114 n=1 Tax=Drosophila sechellia TaxID=7238 RepID=B4I349_DROSE|nr:GM18114 [Drosophila sechellia]